MTLEYSENQLVVKKEPKQVKELVSFNLFTNVSKSVGK